MEYYPATQRNETLKYVILWMDLENIIWWNEPDTEGQILDDSIYMRYPEELSS